MKFKLVKLLLNHLKTRKKEKKRIKQFYFAKSEFKFDLFILFVNCAILFIEKMKGLV
jgi:hypothetical protein